MKNFRLLLFVLLISVIGCSDHAGETIVDVTDVSDKSIEIDTKLVSEIVKSDEFVNLTGIAKKKHIHFEVCYRKRSNERRAFKSI